MIEYGQLGEYIDENEALAKHYKITVDCLNKVRQRWSGRGTVATSPRSGRPTLRSPTKKQELRKANHDNRRLSGELLAFQVKGTTGGGNYRGEKKEHVSRSTALAMKREEGYVGRSVK